MKKKLIVFVLIVGAVSALASATAPAAFAQDAAGRLLKAIDDALNAAENGKPVFSTIQNASSFSLFNHTGFTVKSVFICASGSSDWGRNMLSAFLYDGLNVIVPLNPPPSGQGVYNIRMVDIDGDSYTKYNVKIGEATVVKMGIADFEFER